MRTLSVLLLLAVLAGCSRDPETTGHSTLKIAGSESEKPLVLHLADTYRSNHPDFNVNIKGGGTDEGISALIAGRASIANASRLIRVQEMEAARAAGISLNQLIIAQDVIAIITHPAVGVQHITVADVAAIYSGKITNWKDLGGNNQPIMTFGRQPGSGTRNYMLHRLGIDEFQTRVVEFNNYEEIVSNVAATPGAIAYVSTRFVRRADGSPEPSIWVMNVSLNGMPFESPFDQQAIEYGDYPLMRPLFQYYGAVTSEQKAFIEFEVSPAGQEAAKKAGYIPISDNQRAINRIKAPGVHPDSVKN